MGRVDRRAQPQPDHMKTNQAQSKLGSNAPIWAIAQPPLNRAAVQRFSGPLPHRAVRNGGHDV